MLARLRPDRHDAPRWRMPDGAGWQEVATDIRERRSAPHGHDLDRGDDRVVGCAEAETHRDPAAADANDEALVERSVLTHRRGDIEVRQHAHAVDRDVELARTGREPGDLGKPEGDAVGAVGETGERVAEGGRAPVLRWYSGASSVPAIGFVVEKSSRRYSSSPPTRSCRPHRCSSPRPRSPHGVGGGADEPTPRG